MKIFSSQHYFIMKLSLPHLFTQQFAIHMKTRMKKLLDIYTFCNIRIAIIYNLLWNECVFWVLFACTKQICSEMYFYRSINHKNTPSVAYMKLKCKFIIFIHTLSKSTILVNSTALYMKSFPLLILFIFK